MGDLFEARYEPMNAKERLRRVIIGDSDETWLKRENEARQFMSKYIEGHSEMLEDAVVTVSELDGWVKEQMAYLRNEYVGEGRHDGKDAFLYAHEILILATIRWIVDEFKEKEGDCFIHLCDKGCEAARSRMKKEAAKNNAKD